ncbi:hypothetical protein [Boudabousia marimammalium]|uniref:Uncharacterized protein n=1 Tax=Boudabousia marimammalium TaxID=156892 RepID=A0A1Q5PST7_9ACTO|nr:hypothetical protein [Boudabousia marimammalium]OKL50651.1 hypothetical protein BM477_01510 [Boudabousia marimammalium]
MKKTIIGATALLLTLSLSACGASTEKAAEPTPEAMTATVEAMSTVETMSTVEDSGAAKSGDTVAADKAACEAFAEGIKGFTPPTAADSSDPEKYMAALKPLSAPAYKAAELASSPKLKEAFSKLGEFTEKGTSIDPAVAQKIPGYVIDAREGCAAAGVDSSKTGL